MSFLKNLKFSHIKWSKKPANLLQVFYVAKEDSLFHRGGRAFVAELRRIFAFYPAPFLLICG